MRDDPGFCGRCPVADDSPILWPESQEVVDFFRHAEQSAIQIEAKDKTYCYLRPSEVEALMRIHEIPVKEWQAMWVAMRALQDLSNGLRPLRPKSKANAAGSS